MYEVRTATRDDARALATLAESTFRETFASSNTADDMDLHCRNTYGEEKQAGEIASGSMLTLLCEDAGELVGFAQLRWGQAPACVAAEAPGEIQRLYVASDRHGTGVAAILMNACLERIAGRRSDVAWLGVWERNARAIAFYRKFGFEAVGEHIFPVGTDPQRDVVMARPLVR